MNDYAHFGLGLCLMRQGDRVGARRHLKLAVAMRPEQRRLPRRARQGHGSHRPLSTVSGWRRRDESGRRSGGGADRKVVRCDLDGVIWRGDEPIVPAATGVSALR